MSFCKSAAARLYAPVACSKGAWIPGTRDSDAVMTGEGDGPFWRYFWLPQARRQTSLSLPPKGANRSPSDLFPCKPDAFLGATKGGRDAIRGPLLPAPVRGLAASGGGRRP
jgi:hypothetical protein